MFSVCYIYKYWSDLLKTNSSFKTQLKTNAAVACHGHQP